MFKLLFILFATISVTLGCNNKQLKSNLLVLDGINVSETPSILVEIEALNVPVVLAVSMADLKAFSTVRLIAREAALRGHLVILSGNEQSISGETKRDWSDALNGVPLKYTTKSIEYTLDLSPDHLTAIPQLITEKINETPSLGRVIYLNSFGVGVKGKVMSAVQAYQAAGFQFVSLTDCIKKQ